MANWWRAEVNGAEVARGSRHQVARDVAEYLAGCIVQRPDAPLGFQVRISAARTAHVPARQRLAGGSLEQFVEETARVRR